MGKKGKGVHEFGEILDQAMVLTTAVINYTFSSALEQDRFLEFGL